jgi:excisionase family DNA binding protein
VHGKDHLLTVAEAAEILRVSVITIRRWLSSGKLAARRAGRKLLIERAAVEQLLQTKYVIVRGAPLLPGMALPLSDAELASAGAILLSVLRKGGWPNDLLPITAEQLRPVLQDQAHAGAIFWRVLVRGIQAIRGPQPEMTTDESLALADALRVSGRFHAGERSNE